MTRRVLLTPLAAATLLVLVDVRGVRVAATAAQQPTFRSATEIVLLPVLVRDNDDHFILRLKATDFRVIEGDTIRPVAQFANDPQPLSLAVVVDVSDSMEPAQRRLVPAALKRLASQLHPGDEVCLYTFAESPTRRLAWTEDWSRLETAMSRVPTGGGTALFRAVSATIEAFQLSRQRRQAMLLISDGLDNGLAAHGVGLVRPGEEDNFSDRAEAERALDQLRRREISLFAIDTRVTRDTGVRLGPLAGNAWLHSLSDPTGSDHGGTRCSSATGRLTS